MLIQQARTDRIGARSILLVIGVFLSPFLMLRVGDVNLTIADLCFFGAGTLLVLRGSMIFRWRFGGLRQGLALWFVGACLVVVFLGISSVARQYGNPANVLTVLSQMVFAFIFLPVLFLAEGDEVIAICAKVWVLAIAFAGLLGGLMAMGLLVEGFMGLVAKGQRFGSFMENPNVMGKTIAISMPLFFQIQASSHRFKSLVGSAFVGIGFVFGLFAASSFGGLLAAAVAVGLYLAFGNAWALAIRIVPLAVVMVSGVVYFGFIPPVFERRVIQTLGNHGLEGAGSFTEKLARMSEALNIINDHGLIGLGADAYRAIAPLVHNTYLLVWAEGGFGAFLGVLFMLAGTVWAVVSLWTWNRRFGGTAFIAMAIFWLNAVTNTHIYGRHWMVPLVLAIVHAASCARSRRGSLDETRFLGRRGQPFVARNGKNAGSLACVE